MTDKTIDISVKSLARVHQRNRDLDRENQQKDKAIELLQDTVERLTIRGLQRVKRIV